MILKGHTNSVHQLCWDPTHPEYLATASADKTVRIWDTRSTVSHDVPCLVAVPLTVGLGAKAAHTIKTTGANINIAWSPDGTHIAVGNKVPSWQQACCGEAQDLALTLSFL